MSTTEKPDILLNYIVENDLDVWFLAETWLNIDSDFAFKTAIPEEYEFHNKPRSTGDRGGGIATIF